MPDGLDDHDLAAHLQDRVRAGRLSALGVTWLAACPADTPVRRAARRVGAPVPLKDGEGPLIDPDLQRLVPLDLRWVWGLLDVDTPLGESAVRTFVVELAEGALPELTAAAPDVAAALRAGLDLARRHIAGQVDDDALQAAWEDLERCVDSVPEERLRDRFFLARDALVLPSCPPAGESLGERLGRELMEATGPRRSVHKLARDAVQAALFAVCRTDDQEVTAGRTDGLRVVASCPWLVGASSEEVDPAGMAAVDGHRHGSALAPTLDPPLRDLLDGGQLELVHDPSLGHLIGRVTFTTTRPLDDGELAQLWHEVRGSFEDGIGESLVVVLPDGARVHAWPADTSGGELGLRVFQFHPAWWSPFWRRAQEELVQLHARLQRALLETT